MGAAAAWWLLPSAPWWMAPAAVLAAVAWAGIAWPLAQRRCGVASGLLGLASTLLDAAGIPVPSRPVMILSVSALLLALALPWWPAAVLWLVAVALLAFYHRLGRKLIFGLLIGLVGLGVGLVALPFVSDDLRFWLGLGSGVMLLLALTLLLVSRTFGKKPVLGVFGRLGWVAPAALPFFLVPQEPGAAPAARAVALVAFVGLILWPGAVWCLVMMRHLLALSACRKLLVKYEAPDLIGRPADGTREDAIRQSDGYVRVCHPSYRHLDPDLTGESGYLTWVGGEEKIVDADCVVFRATTLGPNPLLLTPDPRGRALARLVQELLPDLGLEAVQPMRDAILDGWSVRRLNKRHTPLAKMPWDHPFLLVIPVDAYLQLRFPTGSGIHDRDGYPCGVSKADVHLALKPAVLAAVDRLSNLAPDESPSEKDVQLLRLLLWNCWRILPAAYELLLTCLVRDFRKQAVALFAEREPDRQDRASRARFMRGLESAWNESLPEPLASLVTFSVSDLQIDTSFAEEVLERLIELRNREKTQPFKRKNNFEEVIRRIEELVLQGEFRLDLMQRGESETEWLSKGVSEARREITEKATRAVQDVNAFENKESQPIHVALGGLFPVLVKQLEQTQAEFDKDVNSCFDRIDAALREIHAATARARHE
jgi:hypothetical protein